MGNRKQIIDPRGVELSTTDSAWALATRTVLKYTSDGTSSGTPLTAAQLSAAQTTALRALYTTTQEFDTLGRIIKSTDALGGVTSTKYDAFGNAVQIIDPNGNIGYFYFDADNNAQLIVDPEGYATRMVYDAFGRVIQQTRYALRVATGYSASTPLASMLNSYVTTPASSTGITLNTDVTTITVYDRRGHATAIFDAMSVAENYQYDAFGNKIQFIDRRASQYNYDYDNKGQMIREYSPPIVAVTVGSTGVAITNLSQRIINEYVYDARGNLTTLREAVGTAQARVTVTTYDGGNRATHTDLPAISVYNPSANTSSQVTPSTNASYDRRGNKVQEWDANGKSTLSYYDALNRLIARVDVDGTLHEYQYDAAGNLTHERIYSTQLNVTNLVWTTRPTAVANDTYREMYYGYNANNLRTSSTTQVETLFDPSQLLFAQNQQLVGGNGYVDTAITTHSYYDANGNLVRSMDGRGFVNQYYYNKLGQQILVVDPLGYVTRREFDADGHIVRQSQYAQQHPTRRWRCSMQSPTPTVELCLRLMVAVM
jgi:YD repeat-containing protein